MFHSAWAIMLLAQRDTAGSAFASNTTRPRYDGFLDSGVSHIFAFCVLSTQCHARHASSAPVRFDMVPMSEPDKSSGSSCREGGFGLPRPPTPVASVPQQRDSRSLLLE
jgi:hypothetical protein